MQIAHAQTTLEERWNAVTHGVGAVFGLVAFAWVVSRVYTGELHLPLGVAGGVYTASVMLLFGLSAAYHAVTNPRVKRVLQTGDHCAIYVLIAGTYTPYMVALEGSGSTAVLIAVWVLAAVGTSLELVLKTRPEKLVLALYLLMGWLVLVAVVPLIQGIPIGGLTLLLLGGITYSAGIRYYARNAPWDHVIWHGFVLGGAGLHGASLMGFVL